jgi:hypothetical protein
LDILKRRDEKKKGFTNTWVDFGTFYESKLIPSYDYEQARNPVDHMASLFNLDEPSYEDPFNDIELKKETFSFYSSIKIKQDIHWGWIFRAFALIRRKGYFHILISFNHDPKDIITGLKNVLASLSNSIDQSSLIYNCIAFWKQANWYPDRMQLFDSLNSTTDAKICSTLKMFELGTDCITRTIGMNNGPQICEFSIGGQVLYMMKNNYLALVMKCKKII